MKAADALEARTDDFIKTCIAETGATGPWIGFNVMLAAGMLREAASMTTQITGEVIPSDKPGTISMALRQPVGVIVGMAPWNAPVILAHSGSGHAARLRQYGGAQGLGDVSGDPPHDR